MTPRSFVMLLFLCSSAVAQPPVPPRLVEAPAPVPVELRGIVVEAGTNTPIAGASVILRHPLIAPNGRAIENQQDTASDAGGKFTFHGDAAGEYWVVATKNGFATGQAKLTVTSAGARDVRVEMGRAPVISGRVENADTREAAAGLHLGFEVLMERSSTVGPGASNGVATDDNGAFSYRAADAGSYAIRVMPRIWSQERARAAFTEEDAAVVDQDYEAAYWPGGTSQISGALDAPAGAHVNVGTLRVRRVPYYRARVEFPGEGCVPGMRYETRVARRDGGREGTAFEFIAICGKDVLLTGLAPGEYRAVFRPWKVPEAGQQWAFVPFAIVGENVRVTARVEMGADMAVKVMAAKDTAANRGALPQGLSVVLTGEGSRREAAIDAGGMGRLVNVPKTRWDVAVEGLPEGWAVREVRQRGVPRPRMTGEVAGRIDGGGAVEIELTARTGVIEGRIAGDMRATRGILVAVAPEGGEAQVVGLGRDGRFVLRNLPEGEYRLAAIEGPAAGDAAAVEVAVKSGQTVRVDAQRTASIELRAR